MGKNLRIDSEDLEEILLMLERSFAISFDFHELQHVKTFGQLCDAVTAKISLTDTADCTTQQAFYKLRRSLTDIAADEQTCIRPTTDLALLFPKPSRKARLKELETRLDCLFDILRPKRYITNLALIVLLASLVTLFFSVLYGLIGLVSSIYIFKIAKKLGRVLHVRTVGELAEKMVREHYMKARRNPLTVNRQEITNTIKQLFHINLGIKREDIRYNSILSA